VTGQILTVDGGLPPAGETRRPALAGRPARSFLWVRLYLDHGGRAPFLHAGLLRPGAGLLSLK